MAYATSSPPRSRLLRTLLLVLIPALAFSVPQAAADHDGGFKNDGPHEGEPTPPQPGVGGTCFLSGDLHLGNSAGQGGISAAVKNHNHYRFDETTFNCQNLAAGDDMSDLNGSHTLDAAGATDGPWAPDLSAHGEDDAKGWSHKDCYVGTCTFSSPKGTFTDLYNGANTNDDDQCTNCGEVILDGDIQSTNVVMFNRTSSVITAWGAIAVPGRGGENTVCFHTILNVTPVNTDSNTGKVTDVFLTGFPTIWGTDDKATCGVTNHGGKKTG